MAILTDDLRKKDTIQAIEVIGVSWWICVAMTNDHLERNGYKTKINYNCTDLIYDNDSLSRIKRVSINGGTIPPLNPAVLSKYSR
ncbi:hypothetical protein HZA96_07085 [Candidatus Woesearchaeota archaeon]|nr:hypothetical protein [Candidatus Woesearchaeota archaeon]